MGEKLFPEWITLRTDPFHPLFSALPWSDPTGDEGPLSSGGGLWTPARPISWIEKGIVRNLVYDRYWSAKNDRPGHRRPAMLFWKAAERVQPIWSLLWSAGFW